MPQVETWDYPNRRFHLSFDTLSGGVNFAIAYQEERAYRRSNEAARRFLPMLRSNGNVSKGRGRFTPQFTVLLQGARAVPFNASHTLVMLTEPITDDELSGADCFDRLPLSPGVSVNIDVGYSQVEVIIVNSSGETVDVGAITQSLTAIVEAIAALENQLSEWLEPIMAGLNNLLAGLGRLPGISVSQQDPIAGRPGHLRSSDGAVDQEITVSESGETTIRNRKSS